MKKSLVFMMLTGLFLMPTSLHAESITTDGGTNVTITKNVPSHYSVDIPQKVDLENKATVSFQVSAQGDITPTEKLEVKAAPTTVMKRAGDDSYSGQATISFGTITWGHVELGKSPTIGGTVTFDETKAGSYSGVVQFDIRLKSIE